MSREIKFRAWANGYEKWCEFIDTTAGVWLGTVSTTKRNYTTTDVVVEQYTGLNDKNGKEIYEGDIVRLYEHDWWDGKIVKHHKKPKIEGNFVVYYDDDSASFEMENTQPYENGIRGVGPFGYASQEYEVIGNIHENPELLGKNLLTSHKPNDKIEVAQ